VDAWKRIDAFVEVGTPENAEAIHGRFSKSGVNIFSQKNGWRMVKSPADMPASYKQGGIFISAKSSMPW
jgi:hypothetical protein